jgi:hypothetical protein
VSCIQLAITGIEVLAGSPVRGGVPDMLLQVEIAGWSEQSLLKGKNSSNSNRI